MAELLKPTDTLAQGYPKINAAIEQAGQAFTTADNAIDTANSSIAVSNQALANSQSTQEQLNQIVIDGDSSVEAAQARVNADNTITYDTLKERLDAEHQEVSSQLADIAINVKSKGAVGDGITDDTIAIQSAHDELATLGGGTLYFPRGIYLANITVGSFINIKGDGTKNSIIKSVPNSNKDVIQGKNFELFTGTSKETPENRGVRYTNIEDILIDGNKENNTSGYGIRLWGCSWMWNNVIVQNCANDGIWTEFSTHDDPTGLSDPSTQALESEYNFIKSLGNNGNGWTYNGPHDSILNNYTAFSNGGWALYQNKGALFGSRWNSWLNEVGSFYIGETMKVDGMQASAARVGVGVEFSTNSGASILTGLVVGGHLTGIILRGSDHMIDGYIRTAKNAENTIGDGVVLDGTINCMANLIATNCHNFLHKIKEGNTNFIEAKVNVSQVGDTVFTGSPIGTSSYVNIITQTGSTNQNIWQLPTTELQVHGWKPKIPLSNGTMITDETLPTATKRGGVKMQAAQPNITAAPTMDDFNGLLARLRTAGVIAQS